MPCSQTLAGIPADCATSRGGILEAWIGNAADIATKELTDDIITGITLTEGGAKLKHYSFKKGTGSMTSTLTNDPTNGVRFVTTELALTFARMETAKRIEMDALAAADLVVIVKDANGKLWYLGYNEPVTATAGTGQTGTAVTDGNNYQITLTDQSDTYPYEVDEKALAAVID